jgi:hypothetical protein
MTQPKTWSESEEAKIQEIMKAKQVSHAVAARLMVMNAKKSSKPDVAVKAKAEKKAARKPNNSERTFHKPTPKQREEIDALINKATRAAFGHVVAKEGCLGYRYSNSVAGGQPYERYYLENGHTCFVGGFMGDEFKVTVSEKPAVKSSYTVSKFLAVQKSKAARVAAREEKAAKKAEAKKA